MQPNPKKTPSISIVTPSYNQAAFLEEALLSVKKQEYSSVEHIVVDGGSTDGSVELLKRYSSQVGWEHLRWVSERDRGQSDALNKGFRQATGDLIGWLNSDDRYRDGCFHEVVEGITKYPEADVLYGDYTWINEEGRITQVRREASFSYFILQYHHTLCIPSTATFFRRRIFDEGHFIDEDLHYSMDYEYFLRLAGIGYRFKHISTLLADFRWHSQSKTGAAAEGQVREFEQIVRQTSPLLKRLHNGTSQEIALRFLRLAAASRRYSEKLVRGCYIGQIWPSLIARNNQ